MSISVSTIPVPAQQCTLVEWVQRHAELLVRQQCLVEMLPEGVAKDKLRKILESKTDTIAHLHSVLDLDSPFSGKAPRLVDLTSAPDSTDHILRSIPLADDELPAQPPEGLFNSEKISDAVERLKSIRHDLNSLIVDNSR